MFYCILSKSFCQSVSLCVSPNNILTNISSYVAYRAIQDIEAHGGIHFHRIGLRSRTGGARGLNPSQCYLSLHGNNRVFFSIQTTLAIFNSPSPVFNRFLYSCSMFSLFPTLKFFFQEVTLAVLSPHTMQFQGNFFTLLFEAKFLSMFVFVHT